MKTGKQIYHAFKKRFMVNYREKSLQNRYASDVHKNTIHKDTYKIHPQNNNNALETVIKWTSLYINMSIHILHQGYPDYYIYTKTLTSPRGNELGEFMS